MKKSKSVKPTPDQSGPARGVPSGGWFGEAQRILAYRIGVWRERREKPDTLPGMTEAEVKAYYLGHQREAEAMIDLLSAINRGEDTTWAAPSSPNAEMSHGYARTTERDNTQ